MKVILEIGAAKFVSNSAEKAAMVCELLGEMQTVGKMYSPDMKRNTNYIIHRKLTDYGDCITISSLALYGVLLENEAAALAIIEKNEGGDK